MNIQSAWGYLKTHRLDVEHIETHEAPHGLRWEEEKHRGYVARPCKACREPFVVSVLSDAVTCGGHRCG